MPLMPKGSVHTSLGPKFLLTSYGDRRKGCVCIDTVSENPQECRRITNLMAGWVADKLTSWLTGLPSLNLN